jgi:hypothetical protein
VHPVVHPGERPVRALIAARLSKLQRGGQQGIGIDTQDEKSRGGSRAELTEWPGCTACPGIARRLFAWL